MTDKGINCPQYEHVLKKYDRLTRHLHTNKEDRKTLFGKFVVKRWHSPGDCASENDLINIALNRIKDNPTEYEVFIEMLKQITGMANIVMDLKGAFNTCSCSVIIMNYVHVPIIMYVTN